MMAAVIVSELHFVAASDRDRATGLLGSIDCVVQGLLRLSLVLRRTRAGKLTIGYRARRDAHGLMFFPARPADDASRRALEAAVLAALGTAVAP